MNQLKTSQSYHLRLIPQPPPASGSLIGKNCILNHVIDTLDEKEGHRHSLTLKIELQTMDTGETKSMTALLDSGATRMFIDREYIKVSSFTTRMLSNPILVRNIDGTPNEAGSITDIVELNLQYQNHAERVFFTVTSLGRQNVIMGHTWLQKHNPDINWITGDVKMSCCSRRCCSGCRDKICEERKTWKVQAHHIAECSEGEVPDLDRDDDEDNDTDTEVENGDWIFVTNLHQPRKRSMLPPPSLNALQKPSCRTKTLLLPEKTAPL